MKDIIVDKCGSKGCSVEEHEKRLGFDPGTLDSENLKGYETSNKIREIKNAGASPSDGRTPSIRWAR